jgi:ATP-dependent RNA helicase DDX51/DBP6
VHPQHRLQLLLAAVPALAPRVAEYSSHVSASQRAASLAAFKAGRLAVLVTSDAMSRGMDVSSVGAVVNYDPPTFPKTYVHRAGRTARAGSEGAVYSLCKPEDVVHFNGMLRKLAGSRCTQFRLPPDLLQAHRPALRAALQQVQALVALEQEAQQQQPGAVIPAKAAAAARDGGGRKRQHDDGGEGEERQQQQQQKEVAGKRQRKQQKQQQQG